MHDQWLDRLSEYLDDELSATDRRALEEHLSSCDVCRSTLAELRSVVAAARALEHSPPSRELWPNIAAVITSGSNKDVLPLRAPAPRHRISFTMPQLAAAAVILMAVSGAAVWFVANGGGTAEPVSGTVVHTSSDEVPSAVLVNAAVSTDPTYAATVAQLEQTLERERASLDPATVEVIERSLATIDGAMADARAALDADPGNLYLHRQLENTMQKKIAVLQRATRLSRAGT